MQFIYDY